MRRVVFSSILTCCLVLLVITYAQDAKKSSQRPGADAPVSFEKREEMIRMRDGLRLHTLIFTPKGRSERLPIIFNRTPYGIRGTNSDAINERYSHLVKDGYIFVLQDI